MHDKIASILASSIEVKSQILSDSALIQGISHSTSAIIKSLRGDGKILLCGNGGSAADAQHIAAELSGRFYLDRAPLYAEALHVNSSYITAVANDYGFEEVYARMIRAIGRRGDVLIALSTSGNSANVIAAAIAAKSLGMTTIAMTGSSGGKLAATADTLLAVPSTITPRIQECHITIGHIICELVESALAV